jgi:hypothetical protein
MPRAQWWSQGDGQFLMSEVPQHPPSAEQVHTSYRRSLGGTCIKGDKKMQLGSWELGFARLAGCRPL